MRSFGRGLGVRRWPVRAVTRAMARAALAPRCCRNELPMRRSERNRLRRLRLRKSRPCPMDNCQLDGTHRDRMRFYAMRTDRDEMGGMDLSGDTTHDDPIGHRTRYHANIAMRRNLPTRRSRPTRRNLVTHRRWARPSHRSRSTRRRWASRSTASRRWASPTTAERRDPR